MYWYLVRRWFGAALQYLVCASLQCICILLLLLPVAVPLAFPARVLYSLLVLCCQCATRTGLPRQPLT